MTTETGPTIKELADRVRTTAARFDTADAILAECRHLGIKGDRECSTRCIVARLFEHHCEVTPMVCDGDINDIGNYQGTELYVGDEKIDLPKHWSEVINNFDEGKYPDLVQ
jgi:hypothetical protein